MDSDVLAAIITAGAALVVSIVSVWTVLVQARSVHRLQYQAEQERDAREVARQGIIQYQTAIRDCCAAVQEFQDAIQLLLKGTQGSLLTTSARDRVLGARDSVLHVYQRNYTILSSTDRAVLYAIREKAIEAVIALELSEAWSGARLQIPDDQVRDLERAMYVMSQHQQRLLFAETALLPALTGQTR
jgi:hypothetical protein